MKNKIAQLLFLVFCISVFAENQDFINARQLAENGFWNESLVELKKVPKSQKNSDYQLLEAFAKVMTNQASAKDEKYILNNASLENKLILLLKKQQYDEAISYGEKALTETQYHKETNATMPKSFYYLRNNSAPHLSCCSLILVNTR